MSCVVPNKSPRNFSRNKQTFIPVSYRNHQSSASGRVDNTIPVQEKLLHIWLQSLFNYKHIFSFSGCPPERKQGNERERCIFIPFPIAPLYKKKKPTELMLCLQSHLLACSFCFLYSYCLSIQMPGMLIFFSLNSN